MEEDRRTMLAAAGAALLAAGAAGEARAQDEAAPYVPPARPANVPEGRPGDFDFLSGEWRIHHRWRSGPESTEWLEFEGEATVVGILGGICSVEELRIPVRNFYGMGLRVLDQQNKVWHDHWVNKNSGVVTAPGQLGGFANGSGAWSSDWTDENGVSWIAEGIWDQIAPNSTRWRQRASNDGGATWEETWIMHWTRA
ncbi:MAG: hypothetical protein AB7P07_04840 [Hyphomonadaceae bacterium]